MEANFDIELAILGKKAKVFKSPYFLTVIRERLFSVSVDTIPLTEYFIVTSDEDKNEQVKIKIYKTVAEGKWYDKHFSEEAESNSPEFGIPSITSEAKRAVDEYETSEVSVRGHRL